MATAAAAADFIHSKLQQIRLITTTSFSVWDYNDNKYNDNNNNNNSGSDSGSGAQIAQI